MWLSHLLDGFAGGEVEAVISLCFTVANDQQVVLIRQPLLGTAKRQEGQKGGKERERSIRVQQWTSRGSSQSPQGSDKPVPPHCSARIAGGQGKAKGHTPAVRPSGGIDWS